MTIVKSIGAIIAGLLVNVVLGLGTDQILHMLDVYPPWGVPMTETGDNLLALAYRCVYGVAGAYATARLAPAAPMRHALILGGIGAAISLAGAVVAIQMNLGPAWYPILLVLVAVPCSWLGGVLERRGRENRA
ncbi:MAG: hypothetical protein AB7F09_06285 [Parvibaculaceae bacterium]